MPELPEVELYRRYVDGTSLAQRIVEVRTENEGRMLPQGKELIQNTSVGKTFSHTSRVGKFLFLHLDNGKILMWHFGLTGAPVYYRNAEDRPRFERIVFDFDNGFHLAFNCSRKFGRLELTDDVEKYREEKNLGKDAMEITSEEFTQPLSRKKTMIKPALLEQKHFAGIGNWIADEMLFQTKIHPETRCNDLSATQLEQLFTSMRSIIHTAIDHESHYQDFPNEYLVINRKDGGSCPDCGNELIRIVVGGRGTYICTTCQVSP